MSSIRKKLNIFSYIIGSLHLFFRELLFISFAHFAVGLFIFILIDLHEFSIKQGNYLFVDCMCRKYCVPFYHLFLDFREFAPIKTFKFVCN